MWNPYLIKDIKHLEKVQRYATKCINGFQNLTYPERLRKLDLPSLRFRRLRGDIIEVYKLTHGLYDREVQLHLQPAQRISRGHQFKLQRTRPQN